MGSNGLTEQEKKLVMAKVMKTAVLAVFKTLRPIYTPLGQSSISKSRAAR